MDYSKEAMNKNRSCLEHIYTTEITQTNKICMCNRKHMICEILDKSVKPIITQTKVLKTLNGNKILIKGFLAIKFHYYSNNKCGAVLSECFIEPFFATINVPKCEKFEICSVTPKVEYLSIDKVNCRNFLLYALISFSVKTIEDRCFDCECNDFDFCEDDFDNCCEELNFKNDYLNYKDCLDN